MSIKKLFKMLSWGFMPLYFGGGGGSSTASTSVTTQTSNSDSRMVVSDNGVGVSGNSGTVNLSSTDHGAIAGVFDYLKMATNANEANYGKLLSSTGDALKGLTTVADNTKNGGTIDNKTIMMLGLGGLAIAGFVIYKGRK